MTDAAHLLTDFASFMISLLAIYLAARPATKAMSFGWHRAEVVGALISVLLIWVVTGVLFYLAVERVVQRNFEVDGKIMLITSSIGVVVNMIMAVTLHQHGHTHGGGSAHSHGGGDGGGDSAHQTPSHTEASSGASTPVSGSSAAAAAAERGAGTGAKDGEDGHSHNLNVRAAFIHVIGDLIQSVGVMIAAIPDYKLADPICTFIFSVLVLFTTITILKDAMNILMEGVPQGIDFAQVAAALSDIDGVKDVHSLRMWSLTTSRTALSAHLAV
uniref:Zinc transporter 2 n=1 Tax=Macrostomum lignano TaxID=282301 RepID=A0A1I8GRJ5_9PLAT